MTVLLFFFNLLHWSCFVSLCQGLPHIDRLRMQHGSESQSSTRDTFLFVFTAARMFWIPASLCFRKSLFRSDVVIFTSLLFTLVGSSLFISSQGLIDLSKVLSIVKGPSLGLPEGKEVATNLSGGGTSLWIGIIMQAVSLDSLSKFKKFS